MPRRYRIFNVSPFLFGAPQRHFYKQIGSNFNFQELAAGYVGPIVIFVAIYVVIYQRKKILVRLWSIIAAFCFLIAYGIWPFSLISKIPPFNGIANTRLIYFGGFSLLV